VALLSQQAVSELPPERGQALISELFELGLEDLALELMENKAKRRDLLRVPADVMQTWLKDKETAGAHLQVKNRG
jgi:GH24 family phage-related lysozyme (muramidase)